MWAYLHLPACQQQQGLHAESHQLQSQWHDPCQTGAIPVKGQQSGLCLAVVVTNGYFVHEDESAWSWYWLLPWLHPLQTSHRESRWLQNLVCWFGWNTYPESIAIELEHNAIPTSLWIQLCTQMSTLNLPTNLCVCSQLDRSLCGHCITGVKYSACWDSTEHGQIL